MTNDNECCQSSERNLTSNEQFSVCGRRGGHDHDVSEASVLQVPLSAVYRCSTAGVAAAAASHTRYTREVRPVRGYATIDRIT
jgi:hypothetical protein